MMQMPETLTKDIVFVGGGHTHALVLRMWAMNPIPGVRLTVINPEPRAPYSGMLPGFVAGHYGSDELYIDLMRLSRMAGARIILGKVTNIDPATKTITVPGRPPIGYDICSIDIGITSGMPELPGFSQFAVPAKPLDQLAITWERFCQDTGPARIAVLGAGVAGAEMAMAAAHRMADLNRDAQVSLIDRSQALSRLGTRARSKVINALKSNNVDLYEHAAVAEIACDAVRLEDGRSISSNLTLGAAGTRAYSWISDIGLAVEQGYIRVRPTLQSETDPEVFAVGDCAHLSHAPRPKAGVFAVREAPILFENLKALIQDTKLKEYHPQSDYLKLISLGERQALAEKSGVTLSGNMMWRWKDSIDRKFMRQFTDLNPMGPKPDKGSSTEPMLCAGCGSKIGRGALRAALAEAPQTNRDDVIQLPGDDAAVLKFGDKRQVITTDHLRAFCDDPVVMTQIAAQHALGDIWSMGAAPQSALVSVILPRMSPALQTRWMTEITAAAVDVFGASGAAIVGGHSSMGSEFTIGFTVTGTLPRDPITLAGARPGDSLIVTKPLGTGVLLAADMQGRASGLDVANLYTQMRRSLAPDAGILKNAHAMTDITGFGLAGHLLGMCEASKLSAHIDLNEIPVIPAALALAQQGVRSSLYADNLSELLPVMNMHDTPRADLLIDPQTAGGLLAAVPTEHVKQILSDLAESGISAACIGQLSSGPARITLSG